MSLIDCIEWVAERDPLKAKLLRARMAHMDALVQAGVSERRLRFVRWLVEQGRINEGEGE